MSKQHYTSHKKPHYYINPISGRVIKSSSKMFKELEKKKLYLYKDTCLYDISSAKKCLSSIILRYKGLVHPSSNFMNIPSTYNKKYKAKGFIKNRAKTHVSGFINKKGKVYKLHPEILLPLHKITEVVSLEHHLPILYNKIETSNKATKREHSQIISQLNSEPIKNLTLLFNPIQDDIIPLEHTVPYKDHDEIIKQVNEYLIPTELQSIKDTNISGIITNETIKGNKPTKILGFTNTNNETKKFKIPIDIENYILPDYFNEEIDKQKSEVHVSNYDIPSNFEETYIEKSKVDVSSYNVLDYFNKETDVSDYNVPLRFNEDTDDEKSEVNIFNYDIPIRFNENTDEEKSEVNVSNYDIPIRFNEETDEEKSEINVSSEEIEAKPVDISNYDIPLRFSEEIEANPVDISNYDIPLRFSEEIEAKPVLDYNIPEFLNEIPKINIDEEELKQLPKVDKIEEQKFKKNLIKICGINKQLDKKDNKCYPCDFYNLVWDSKLKKCKTIEKSKEDLSIIIDNKGKIKGYTDSKYLLGDYRRRFAYATTIKK